MEGNDARNSLDKKLEHVGFCQERADLLAAVANTSACYTKAVLELSASAPILLRADYQSRREETEILRVKAENTRNALADHRREHGC
jgi:hypothetical protein